MTAKKDLKRLVRARARKTGESYAAALRHFRKQVPEEKTMAAPASSTRLRRVEKPQYGFAVQLPEDWAEEPADPFNSEWEVARFRLSGPSGSVRNCLVFRSPEKPDADPRDAARRAETSLGQAGFGNFRHVHIKLGGLPAARLDFDRPWPNDRIWSCRHHFVVAAGHLFCLSFGTTAIEEDAPLLDELTARFEFIGDPPGASSPSAAGSTAAETQPPLPAIRIDADLRRRIGPYTVRARRVLVVAHEEAVRRHAPAVDQEHVLAGIALVAGSAGLVILANLGISQEQLQRALESILPPAPTAAEHGEPTAAGSEPEVVSLRFTERAERTLTLAEEEARSLGQSYVGVEHLVLSLLRQDTGPAAELLARLGVTADAALAALRKHLASLNRPGT